MKLFDSLKSIFTLTKGNKTDLKFSDIKLGELCHVYEEHLKSILHFHPIIREEYNQKIFFNVVFERVKFENFSFIRVGEKGARRVEKIIAWSTYEEQEMAMHKLHQIQREICSKFKQLEQYDDPETYLKPAHCYEYDANTIIRLGLRRIREYGAYGYAAEISFLSK